VSIRERQASVFPPPMFILFVNFVGEGCTRKSHRFPHDRNDGKSGLSLVRSGLVMMGRGIL
jgi:hypothetical protein